MAATGADELLLRQAGTGGAGTGGGGLAGRGIVHHHICFNLHIFIIYYYISIQLPKLK